MHFNSYCQDETYQHGSVHEPLNRDSLISGVTSTSTTHEDFAHTEFESLTAHSDGDSRSDGHRDQDVTRVSTNKQKWFQICVGVLRILDTKSIFI